ncbi:hypothetical protein JCM11641_007537 [Rhodosporidiobolus odoratus]
MPPHAADAARTADVGTSVRSRSKGNSSTGQSEQRKTVYRTVLDNPLSVQWPPLPSATRQAILDELLNLLSDSTTEDGRSVVDWRLDEHARRRGKNRPSRKLEEKQNKAADAAEEAPPQLVDTDGPPTASSSSPPSNAANPSHFLITRSSQTYDIPDSKAHSAADKAHLGPSVSPPAVLSHLVVGINEVTRALETRVRWGRWELGDAAAAPLEAAPVEIPRAPGRPRQRRRKSSSTPSAIPPGAHVVRAPPSLRSLAAYKFAHYPAPSPSPNSAPPYLLPPATTGGSWQMLVNSEARRLKPMSTAKKGGTGSTEGDTAQAKEPAQVGQAEGDEKLITGPSHVGPSTIEGEIPNQPEAPTTPLVDLVFLCKPDINPPSLVAHLPSLVAAANGVQEALDSVLRYAAPSEGAEDVVMGEKRTEKRPVGTKVLIVPLDVGAERKLADALGLRRVAAIGLSSSALGASSLLSLVERSTTPLNAPWLVPQILNPLLSTPVRFVAAANTPSSRFIPTHIKHVRTTAPLNPKAANIAKKKQKREWKDAARQTKRRKSDGEMGGGGKTGVYVAED